MLDQKILSQIDAYKSAEKDKYFLDDLEKAEQSQDEQELYERFYTNLEFGTGGIRGIIEAGTNRLNTLIVQRVAEGWAQYLKMQFSVGDRKIVIAYDSRHFSDIFSRIVSEVLTAHGIKVYTYTAPRPTPQLSFSIRALDAQSGLVITASHNPPKYNGLKIYWEDGAQVIAPHDKGIMDEIAKANSLNDFPKLDLDTARSQGLYEELGKDMDERFQDYVVSVLQNPDVFQSEKDFKIVYTPLHGTGAYHIEALMQKYNIQGIIEPSQKEPDGDFPTVRFPNPEEHAALENAIATAKKSNAQLVVATDPDADRVGLAEKNGNEFVCLTGNQVGALLLDYILHSKKEKETLKNNSIFVNTIVTTRLQEKIAASFGVDTIKTFTGFKNLAEGMTQIERTGRNFVFACEESYGYLASMNVRDKDGISITLLCIEMAKYYDEQGIRLMERLNKIYSDLGYHKEHAINKVLEGSAGKAKIASIMEMLRNNPPQMLGIEKLAKIFDYQEKTIKSSEGKVIGNIEGFSEKSNVLIFETESGNELCMRPSGTEPKIKFYFLYSQSDKSLNIDQAKDKLENLIAEAEKSLEGWLA